jgi:ankyrin repeat protein
MATRPPSGFFEFLKKCFDWDAPDDPAARFLYYVETGRVAKARSCLGSPHRRSFLLQGDPTPLQIAAARGDARMVELLLSFAGNERAATTMNLRRGSLWRAPETADLFALTDCPKNALALARLSGDDETYRILLKDAEQVELDWALLAAALKMDLPWMRELVERGASPNAPDAYRFDGWTPFLRAVKQDFLDGVELLLSKGADLRKGFNPPDYGHDNDVPDYYSPLYLACENESLRVAEKLLDAGADPDRGLTRSSDQLVRTPLMCAYDRGFPELGRLLVSRGADPALLADKWREGRSVREEHRRDPDPRWNFLASS